MARIFISYKRDDKDVVFKIKDDIEKHVGELCWIDLDGVESDAQFVNVIMKAIDEADIFLFMYSKKHAEIIDFENDWTVREINYAYVKRKRIIFLNIDGTHLSDWFIMMFGLKQQININYSFAMNKLYADLRKWFDHESVCNEISSESNLQSNVYLDKNKIESYNFRRGASKSLFSKFTFIVSVFIIIGGMLYYYLNKKLEDNGQKLEDNSRLEIIETNGYEYVDLGLSVKWATCNIGATTPEEYGDYFAWGEGEPKENYAWATYRHCINTKIGIKLKKYCNNEKFGYNAYFDTINMLALKDDAAHINWGGSWRMPTLKEFEELQSKCTHTWTSQNGIYGCKFESFNGNSIFLPAVGHKFESEHDYNMLRGYYWSSSLHSHDTYSASVLELSQGTLMLTYYSRYYGLSIRPVCP